MQAGCNQGAHIAMVVRRTGRDSQRIMTFVLRCRSLIQLSHKNATLSIDLKINKLFHLFSPSPFRISNVNKAT